MNKKYIGFEKQIENFIKRHKRLSAAIERLSAIHEKHIQEHHPIFIKK